MVQTIINCPINLGPFNIKHEHWGTNCAWLVDGWATGTVYFHLLIWAWRFLWDTIVLRNTCIHHMGRILSCSRHLGTLELWSQSTSDWHKNTIYGTSWKQACNTTLNTVRTLYIIFFIWAESYTALYTSGLWKLGMRLHPSRYKNSTYLKKL